ncbi:MAG: hypothetical protein IPI31_17565 [Bacteroidetes bacterium]|nr:hypothetical protein [Bacteroidota bacterium]MBK7569632.1 hypothetical protein [Bacteroidota bacterium]
MQLDYIHNINNSGEHMVRLYNFDMLQAIQFRKHIQDVILIKNKPLNINELDFIEARNCELTLRIADDDIGIVTEDTVLFFCDLTLEGFQEMVELLAPFCLKETKGYQWLYDIDNEIDFLFSPGGTW